MNRPESPLFAPGPEDYTYPERLLFSMHFVVDNLMLFGALVLGLLVGFVTKGKMLASSIAQAKSREEVKSVFIFDFMAMGSLSVGLVFAGDYMGDIIGMYTRLGGCLILFLASCSFGAFIHHVFIRPIFYQKVEKVD